MRRAISLALMTALLLCGCGNDARQREMAEKARLSVENGAQLTADVTADLGEETFSFTAECTVSTESAVIKIVSPDIIAGVTARIGRDGAGLEFDGLILDLGSLAEGGYGPLGALDLLLRTLLSGPVTESFEQDGMLAVQSYADESSYALIWYGEEDLKPVHAELITNGREVLSCRISDFSPLQGEKEG